MTRTAYITLTAFFTLGFINMDARGDEGMWLFEAPPLAKLKAEHGVVLTPATLDHWMKANVRFNSGGSGGFVSRNGLIVTNHHIAADALQKLSTKERDLFAEGFLAKSPRDELPCPDLELNVLQAVQDVTAEVNAAVKPELKPAEAVLARRKAMAELEATATKATGLRCDVVTLYQGGAYHLYRSKKYTDVRLVFAPEAAIAGFGGDVDNFEYPRFGLDVAFFRAYENGKPALVPHFFRWNAEGPKENETVFVTGHPGTTNRLETLAKIQHRRDHTLPYTLNRLRLMEAALTHYGDTGPEQRRQAATDLHRVANARKAFSGQLQGLLDRAVMERKELEEHAFVDPLYEKAPAVAGETWHEKKYPNTPWAKIYRAQLAYQTFEKEYGLLEAGHAFAGELFAIARNCVRLNAELAKPSGDRLREYRDSNLESLKFGLYSPARIEVPLEKAKLQASITFLAEILGGDNELVALVLDGKNPAQRASELAQSQLRDVEYRKAVVAGNADKSDAMLQLAIAVDERSRLLRKRYEIEIDEVEKQNYAEISRLRFKAFGDTVAPDATFTLRLAYGRAKGYDVDGVKLPFHTTFAGAFARSEQMKQREPFELPKRWLDRRSKLKLDTPFNFVSTADTIGGNSGSPVLNVAGELIGVNFDRNRHGLVRNFVYTEEQARHIAVHSAAVLEALRNVYDASELLKELTEN